MTENSKPTSTSVNVPLIVLIVLFSVVLLLIYQGYDYLSDDPATVAPELIASNTDDEPRANVPAVSQASDDEEEAEPEEKPKKDVTKEKEPEQPKAEEKPKPAEEEPEKETAVVSGPTSITHEVQAGETFHSIRRRYNLSEETLKSLNPDIQDVEQDMKAGVTKLKVKVKAVHTVGPGDVFSKIAEKYGVKKELIMAANARTQDRTNRGEKIIIPMP